MQIKMVQPAPEGTVFAPDAFADSVGRLIPLAGASSSLLCTLDNYTVAGDGRAVEFELDVPDDLFPQSELVRGLSIAEG